MSERKYRQRGYQDSEPRDRSLAHGTGPPRGQTESPRGRGLGKPTTTVFRCAICGALQPRGEVAADATCGDCGADLHSCTHCAGFDPAARWQCRKPIAAPIANKAKRNDCGAFVAKASQELGSGRGSGGSSASGSSGGRSAFDALFDS